MVAFKGVTHDLGGVKATSGADPVSSTDLVTKEYADNKVPNLGIKLIGLGHSFMQGYGAIPIDHGFMSQVAGLMRSKLWNMGVPGAKLAGVFAAGVNGYGGIPQILQQYLPPKQPILWLGAYSGATYYTLDDGVTNAPAAISCTTNGTTALTSAALFGAAYVKGMYLSGTNIKPGTYVVSVNSTSGITMSQAATGSGTQNLIFTGWYHCGAETIGVAPAGAGNGTNWDLVDPNNIGYFGSPWNPQSSLPVMMWGQNDITQQAQRNPQPFLSAFQAMCCRIASAMVWEDTSPMITLAGGVFTNFTMAALAEAAGSGTSITTIPNTAGATISFFSPPDWPGGFVDIGFTLLVTGSALASGSMTFTVDGSNVNCKCSGMADGPTVNFGSPVRQPTVGCALGTALTSGVASGANLLLKTPLPNNVGSGANIVVGGVGGGSSQTFVTTGTALAGALSIPVTSQVANATYPVGTPVYDSTTTDGGWAAPNCIAVRVPVPAGSHQVIATVPGSPSIANLAIDHVSFESSPSPIGVVLGVWKPANLQGMGFNCPTYQDIDTWNTAIQGTLGLGNEWPHVYANISDVLMQTSALTTALTLGQTGVTSLAITGGIKVAVASGDIVQVGSGATVQLVTASASAAVGATAITVTSFTSTFAQPIGTPISNFTVASKNFNRDGVHPSTDGHAAIAGVVYNAIVNSLPILPQTAAMQSEAMGRPTAVVNTNTGADLAVGSATSAGAWVISGAGVLQLPAEPGDLIEIDLNGIWDASATVIGSLDIATFNLPAYAAGNSAGVAACINYLSGIKSIGGYGGTTLGLGYDAVGAQGANGLAVLMSNIDLLTLPGRGDRISGKFYYPVQWADIIAGYVYFCVVGKSSTTTVRHIKNVAGYNFLLSAVNVGPVSYGSEA